MFKNNYCWWVCSEKKNPHLLLGGFLHGLASMDRNMKSCPKSRNRIVIQPLIPHLAIYF